MLFPSVRSNMGFSVHWSWHIALIFLLCMGGEVRCDCTETNMQIEGGHYKLTKQLRAGSMLVYNCPEGYYPHPARTRLCQPNGSWRPSPKMFSPQRCRLVECPDPSVLEYGNVSPPQEKYYVDNETTYECYSGYTLRGSSSRVCLPSGKWSGSTPICSRASGDHCAHPGIPAGASRTGHMFGIDDTVRYSCNGNLILVGSNERVCQENGQWSGNEPACYYKHTYDTSLEVSEEFGSAIKNTLAILEPNGGIEMGRKIAVSTNGSLNIYIAVDISESIDPIHITNSREAIKTLIRKISSFTVAPNYEILFYNCEIYEVVNILDFWDGTVPLSSIWRQVENFTMEDKTTIGSDLNLVFKTFLERMAMIKMRVGAEAFKEHRHVLIVFTDGAYNMGEPAPTVAKIKDIVYRGGTGEAETQSREEYLDIYIFAIGEEIFDDDLKPLTVGTGGRHYFRMKDISNLQETFDDIIDEGDVKGLCGLHKDFDTGTKESKKKRYPWVAFIIIQKDGVSRKCLGSLVSPDFVLTAAHCFPFGTLPEHITVEIDDGRGRVKKVKMFKIHDRYNVAAKVQERVQQFFDYDVALIQLEKPVEISAAARPICIPCTKETSQALKLGGTSTCEQQERLLLKNHLESLSFLTRTSNFIDEKSVQAKLGDNRQECIRHALAAEGVDTDDPEVAVTENFLCTGGRSPYRDHIACRGDAGGAVFKNYELRTIQVALVSWGNKDLCKSSSGLVESDDTSRDFHINLFRVVPFLKAVLGNDNQDEYAPLEFLDS
ncbi:complement factor B-like [Acanthopagrus schlegelii]